RAYEIRVVGIREPICPRASRAHHRGFLKGEHGVARPGGDEDVRDRLRSLRIRDCVTDTIEHGELRALSRRDLRDEVSSGRRGGAKLEMRRARAAERAAAEQCTAQVGNAATSA